MILLTGASGYMQPPSSSARGGGCAVSSANSLPMLMLADVDLIRASLEPTIRSAGLRGRCRVAARSRHAVRRTSSYAILADRDLDGWPQVPEVTGAVLVEECLAALQRRRT